MSKWTDFVKEFAAKNNLTYGCALSDPRCSALYRKAKGETPVAKATAKAKVPINRTAVVALFQNDRDFDNFVILTDGSVLRLDEDPIRKVLITKQNSISDAWDWLKKNLHRKENAFFKTNYTYNQLTGSESDYKLLDKYDLEISQPSTATKLLFYDEFSKRAGYAERYAEEPYETR